MNTDIKTREGWQRYLDLMCEGLSKAAADEEMKLARCDLILTANPETGEAWPPSIYGVLMQFNGTTDEEVENLKDRAASSLRAIAVAGCCVGSIFCSEAWMSHIPADDPERLHNRVQPKDDPERKEGIVLAIHHREFGPETRRAMISRVNGKRVIEDWETLRGASFAGRFGSFVPPDGFVAEPAIVDLTRKFIKQLGILDDMVPIDEMIERLSKEAP
jgi:hypothetical protein